MAVPRPPRRWPLWGSGELTRWRSEAKKIVEPMADPRVSPRVRRRAPSRHHRQVVVFPDPPLIFADALADAACRVDVLKWA